MPIKDLLAGISIPSSSIRPHLDAGIASLGEFHIEP